MKYAIGLFLTLLLCACDKPCETTVEEKTQIINTTTESYSLSVCVLSYPKEKAEIEVPGQSDEPITLRKNQRYWVQGGVLSGRSCSTAHASKPINGDVAVRLTEAPAKSLKFCIEDKEKGVRAVIVAPTDNCPEDFTEQSEFEVCKAPKKPKL